LEGKVAEGKHRLFNSVLFVSGGILGLVIGAKLVVENALNLGKILGVSDSYMGLTVVAFGTSLPELATSAVAAYRKNSDIAIGNVIGSNIFNICLILGVSALINPLAFGLRDGIDFLVATIAMLLFLLAMLVGKRLTLTRWEGALFFSLYIGYLALRFQIDRFWR
jgi:cation:H+ antiporter